MKSKSLWLAPILSGILTSLAAGQGTYPAQLQGIPTFGSIPYGTGSYGPVGPILDPAAEADLWAYAKEWWTDMDTSGAAGLSISGWSWSAPTLVAIEDPTLPANSQVDPWNGGYELFEYMYGHRLSDAGPASFSDLCLMDPSVALSFKHYTLTHQVVTSPNWDSIAHQNHVNILTDGLTLQSYAESRGIPFSDANFIVSDRTSIQRWANAPQLGPLAPGGDDDKSSDGDKKAADSMKECIEMKKKKLKGKNLYKADKRGGFFGGGADPGFDCDDFADAMGAHLTKDKEGASYKNVYAKWTGGNKKKAAHLITMVSAGGQYWLVDAQTGLTSGPHADGTPIDATPITEGPGGYGGQPGSTRTDQDPTPPNDRSEWQGVFGSGEPEAWHTDPEEVTRFEGIMGRGTAECFIQ